MHLNLHGTLKACSFSDAEDYQLKISFHSSVMASVGVDVIFNFPLLASLQQTLVHATSRSLHYYGNMACMQCLAFQQAKDTFSLYQMFFSFHYFIFPCLAWFFFLFSCFW